MQAVTGETFETEVLQASHERPVLVDFWGPRCAPCLKMMPWVESLAESAADAVKVVKVNSAEQKRLCLNLHVMGLPTFVLFRDGQEVQRLTGDGCTPQTLSALLQSEAPGVALPGTAPAAA